MSNQTTAVQKQEKEDRQLQYVPFGAADPIKLNLTIIKTVVAVPTRSGKTCTDRDGIKFMMLCQAQRLNPFAGDAFLVGYDGKNGPVFNLITAHQSLLKRAETCSDYEGMESGIILVDENSVVTEREGDFCLPSEEVVGGWARVYRKGRKPTYRRLAIAAMMPNYETPFWSEQKAPGQIVKCAEADALRATFPTLIGGLYTEAEILDLGRVDTTREEKRVFEAPRLVDVVPATENAGDAKQNPPPADPQAGAAEPSKPQDDLADFVIRECGSDFNKFQAFCMDGAMPAAETMGGFDEVPTKEATRLLRSKAGLKAGLEKLK